jgi:hypothetical protein
MSFVKHTSFFLLLYICVVFLNKKFWEKTSHLISLCLFSFLSI